MLEILNLFAIIIKNGDVIYLFAASLFVCTA